MTLAPVTARRHEFPQWRPQDLSRVFPSLEESGLELLRAMLQYDPARRISVSWP
jgi:cyclin-dependent kinase